MIEIGVCRVKVVGTMTLVHGYLESPESSVPIFVEQKREKDMSIEQ